MVPRTRNLVILVVLVLVLMLVAFLIVRKTRLELPESESPAKELQEQGESKNTEPQVNESQAGIGPINSLISTGKSLRCIYSSTNTSKNKQKGMVYLDGATRVRTDSQLTRNGTDMEVHVINNGAALYTWTINEKGRTATTMPLQPAPASSSPAHILYDTVRYNCNAWDIDASLFTPPSEITFTSVK